MGEAREITGSLAKWYRPAWTPFPVENSLKLLGEGNKSHFTLWLADVKRKKSINPEGEGQETVLDSDH